jgi:hypothetical protein
MSFGNSGVNMIKGFRKSSYYVEEIPKCHWCSKSNAVKEKTIWFEIDKLKHYVSLWYCKKCKAIITVRYWS